MKYLSLKTQSFWSSRVGRNVLCTRIVLMLSLIEIETHYKPKPIMLELHNIIRMSRPRVHTLVPLSTYQTPQTMSLCQPKDGHAVWSIHNWELRRMNYYFQEAGLVIFLVCIIHFCTLHDATVDRWCLTLHVGLPCMDILPGICSWAIYNKIFSTGSNMWLR